MPGTAVSGSAGEDEGDDREMMLAQLRDFRYLHKRM